MSLLINMSSLRGNNAQNLKKGALLVSEPLAEDPYFSRSVVLLLSYNDEGAMGLVLNKPMRVQVKQVFPGKGFKDEIVYLGGPVESDRVFYVHNVSFVEGAVSIRKGLCVGGDLDDILKVVRSDETFFVKFFLGYAGWYSGQLEVEMEKAAWVSTSLGEGDVLCEDERFWFHILRRMNNDYCTLWANTPKDPNSN